ncbi:hypothetical protein [Paenibacillus polymyxa]|uniref:hypothetical protein n=1 Tax=Paenibacillus polymyxa TaxID=1406 RepID=UPI00021BBA86|nr:hypothetical protein [Paenibacillus polymyxa]MDN4106134.1 hypothetical protein [Paenibacillus polymyxa]CCC86402.1 hypothetical protein PPM_p0252 [Paenibacillus polymyxa M1]
MSKQISYTMDSGVVTVKLVEDLTQQNIIAKRRKQREQVLKQIGQRTSVTEQDIEQLVKLTK